MSEMIYIGGFSGGIDSQAAARFMLNRYGPARVVLLNTEAGGNECPVTPLHVKWYSENVHHVEVIVPLVGDYRSDDYDWKGLDPEAEQTFQGIAKFKGRFPSKMMQFCTESLKLAPQRRWMREVYPGGNYARFSGVRRDESKSRSATTFTEEDKYFDCEQVNPVFDWTKQMAFDYVKAHRERINLLYSLGFNRVGCMPCVNLNKDELLNTVKRFPEMIDKVRVWEKEVGSPFFHFSVVPGMAINWIDDVVAWSKTDHGGRQPNMFRVLNEPASCESKFGLCE